MILEIFLALLLGILVGCITGLIPGIHINLIGALLISLSATLLYPIEPLYLILFIVSTSITHTFLDFIPSIFLGCPDTSTELSILPGHSLLKIGRGYEAIMLTAYGSLAAVIILSIIAFPSILVIDKFYNLIKNLIPYFLILISILLISFEKQKFRSTFVFILTGILGFILFNLKPLSEPLLPLLTGLFGASTIIISIKNKTKIPEQKITLPKTELKKPILGSVIAAPLCSFLPSLGSSQAAIIANSLFKTTPEGFLILIGITNTLVMGFSFLSLYTIGKTRTGAAVAIKNLTSQLSQNTVIMIIISILIIGIISFFLTKKLAQKISTKINSFNYSKISFATLTIITIVVTLVSGILGLLVFAISTATGLYAISLNVKRTNMMGCLIIPTILLYLL